MRLITAARVLPMAAPPIEGGGVVVEGGAIRDVGPAAALARAYPGAEVEDLGPRVLLPGLVNCHAHLELTGIGEPPLRGDFASWIRAVIEIKRAVAPGGFADAIDAGARACIANGQTSVANVLGALGEGGAHPAAGPRVLVQPELIHPGAADVSSHVDGLARVELSPPATLHALFAHAPYTVSAKGYREAAARARLAGVRFATHLAESDQEVRWALTGEGPVADVIYRELPVTPPATPGAHPFDHLERLGVIDENALLVHMVHMDGARLDRLADAGAAVVVCPRSNRALGVGRADLSGFRARGVPVGLGTDSWLAWGDVNLWAEMMAAVEDYGLSPREAVELATVGGAHALGRGAAIGSFRPGMLADILAVEPAESADPWESVLYHKGVAALWLGGEKRR